MMLGITLQGANGLGDRLQFASFPENYFKNTGEAVVDLDSSWIFDHNPYVVRGTVATEVVNLWTVPWKEKSSRVAADEFFKKPIFFSQAERTAGIFDHIAYLRHPRLYAFEDTVRKDRRLVLHTTGNKHAPIKVHSGEDSKRIMPEYVIEHVRNTYRGWEILQVGSPDDLDAGVTDCRGTESAWDLVRIIAEASLFIGVDSGPSWIAACFPQIFNKKLLVQYPPEFLRKSFVPMHLLQPSNHWHDPGFMYYNRSTADAGVTYSYLKL